MSLMRVFSRSGLWSFLSSGVVSGTVSSKTTLIERGLPDGQFVLQQHVHSAHGPIMCSCSSEKQLIHTDSSTNDITTAYNLCMLLICTTISGLL